MKSTGFGVFLIMLVILNACSDSAKWSDEEEMLIGCWTHSYEEQDTFVGLFFRPCDHMTFPLSHFRHRFTLQKNYDAEYLQLSPVDAHTLVDGTWAYDRVTKELTIDDIEGKTVYRFEVLKADEDHLLLKPI